MSRGGVDPAVTHVVVGPEEHGVTRHGRLVARACASPLVEVDTPRRVEITEADVVHVSFTDRLFGERAEESATAFRAMVQPWTEAGLALSVTLHDLPDGDSDRELRRLAAYREVVACAHGVVVNSRRELQLAQRLTTGRQRLRCIPLPVEHVAYAPRPEAEPPAEVVVLGFLFPDRGYEHTVAELPTGVDLVALGRPSVGHDDLPARLADLAAQTGHAFTTTGFVADAALGPALRRAGVPVAPNRRVSASGSVNTWVAHGRRPLVPDSPYSRELDARAKGSVVIYDADEPGALRHAIAAALADPSLTWVAPGTVSGPSVDDVGRLYRRHFAGCAPARAHRVDDRRWVVPGNRWDLLAGLTPVQLPSVTVVIPHFEAQRELDLVLTALSHQTHPASRLEIVVADDGSAAPPSVACATVDAVVVRQQRDGFRAAAARNLGAAAGAGEVIVFLDGDTVPERDYVSRISRLPALTSDALTVGRRRHADLTGWTPARLAGWLDGTGPPPVELPEPGWLRDAYAASGDLLVADERSYRYAISAVMALSRDLWSELGGFDERFRAYGGEDWELAHRAWAAGAVLAHVPEAVAWHDGPDWAGRQSGETGDGAAGASGGSGAGSPKNNETLTLTALLPDPEARGGGQWRLPAIAVELAFADPVAVLATARAAFSGDADCAVWVDHPEAAPTVRLLDDPRIHAGPVPRDVLDRAQAVLHLDAPARVTGLSQLLRRSSVEGPLVLPTGRLTPRRAARRAERWASALEADEDVLRARLFGGSDLPAPLVTEPVDLAHELKHLRDEPGGAKVTGGTGQDVSRS